MSAWELYTISHNGQVLFESLTQEEYFDKLAHLAEDYYSSGSPNPSELITTVTKED